VKCNKCGVFVIRTDDESLSEKFIEAFTRIVARTHHEFFKIYNNHDSIDIDKIPDDYQSIVFITNPFPGNDFAAPLLRGTRSILLLECNKTKEEILDNIDNIIGYNYIFSIDIDSDIEYCANSLVHDALLNYSYIRDNILSKTLHGILIKESDKILKEKENRTPFYKNIKR
jgi:hypothetical protein